MCSARLYSCKVKEGEVKFPALLTGSLSRLSTPRTAASPRLTVPQETSQAMHCAGVKGTEARDEEEQGPHHPRGHRGSSRVVPDTPTNTPKSLTDTSRVTMVLETPEDLMGESGVLDSPGGGPEGSTSNPLAAVKLRRRKILSFLESDFSQGEDGSTASSDNDTVESQLTPKEQRLWSKVLPALGTPQNSRKRRSMANIIVPSDLNDRDFLAAKLSHIQQEEESARARRRSSTHSTPRAAPTTPEVTRRDPQQASTSSRARQGRTSVLGTPQKSWMRDRGSRECTTTTTTATTTTTTTTTTTAEDCNATILFNDEDLQLTPVHCRERPEMEGDRQTTTTTAATATPTGTSEDALRHLQTRKSPLLQLRKFNTTATQKMVKELKEVSQRTRRGEELGGPDCLPLVLHSTPQRKDGSSGSAGSAKDPSCVLKGVVAYVEVRVDGENRSAVIKEQLGTLGAKVEARLTRNTTHVIFRDGSKAMFLRARERGLHILSTLWVEACRVSLSRAPESKYPSTSMETYSSDIHIPKKFRRSMHVKNIEEDLKLAEARMRRRKRNAPAPAATPPTDPIPPGYCTPRHRLLREDVNSPLYSIRHLLSPHLKGSSSGSCGEEEEEEEEDEDGICTPLAKRLFKKFMLRQEASKRKVASQELVAEAVSSEAGGGRASGTGDASDSLDGGQDSLKLRLEESDSFSRRASSEMGSENNMSLPRRLSVEVVTCEGNSLPRQLTEEAPNDSVPPRRPGLSHGESLESLPVRLDRNEVKNCELPVPFADSSGASQDKFALPRRLASSCTKAEGQGGTPRSRGSGCFGSVDSSSSGSMVETPVVARRRQSVRLRARLPESEGFSEGEEWEMRRGNKKNSSKTDQSLTPLAAEETAPKNNKKNITKANLNLVEETTAKTKPDPASLVPREEPTPENKKENNSTKTSSTIETIPASQIAFPSTQISCSQRGRRRLMTLDDEIVPSQDLITPATPKDKRRGPYDHLLHPQDRKTKRKRLSRELFAQRNTNDTNSTNAVSASTAPSTSGSGTTGTSESSRAGRSSSSRSDTQKHKESSGDDSVFGEERIVMLPRSRRSTEEFRMVAGRPKPRGSVRKGCGKRKSCPPSRFSSSSSSGSSSSSMCLTSLHSSDKRTVIPIIRKLGGYRVGEGVDQQTSHVVCGEQRRTLNLLLGIARGCWVLDVSWVYRSLEGNAWAPEEPFELTSFAPGAKACRQQREAQGSSYQHTLFSKVGGVCVLDGSSPPAAQLKELLELCGASVVPSVRNAKLVVGGGDGSHNTLGRRRRIQVTHVSENHRTHHITSITANPPSITHHITSTTAHPASNTQT
ncbi:hypothetical protein O3P69_013061 [Scylla paramamosain]|uniref:BRCT domain-containing protein n=1 Tax=Scylla paramamosain TaxID=85552 RepID=A0AAW0TUH0_SCYPA